MGVGQRDVRDIVSGTLRDVDKIATSPAVMHEVLGDLRTAERILAAKLRKQVTKHGTLDGRFTGAQALSMQGPVLQAIDYVQDRIRGRTTAQAEQAISTGLARTVTTMEGLEKRFTGIATPVRLRQAAELSTASANAKGMWARNFPTSVDRYGVKMLGEFEEIIRGGLVAGSSMDEMIGALTGHGGPTGKVSMSAKVTPAGVLRVKEADIPEGLFVRHKYWAERMVRTEVLRAYNGARQAGLESMGAQFPDMKRKILATLDKRTAPDSMAVHGQIRGIKDPFTDGAGRVYLYPPARPNDRETVIPWRDAWEDASENLSEWEKAAIGEDPDEETEKKLEAMLTGKAPGKARGKRAPKAVQPKAVQTINAKVEADLRSELKWEKLGATGHTLTGGGSSFGFTYQGPQGFVTQTYDHAGMLTKGTFATSDEARAHITTSAHQRLAKTSQLIRKWDEKAYFDAVAADDPSTSRLYVRGLMYENGVLPRDMFRVDHDQSRIVPTAQMQDALASHGWGGRVSHRADHWEDGKSPLRHVRANHLRVAVHEEMHGATNFSSPAFYVGHGSVVEEATVEMAARHITKTAMPSLLGDVTSAVGGSYQTYINELVHQIALADLDGGAPAGVPIDFAEVKTRIAKAGIAMRAPKARAIETHDGILKAFAKHVAPKAAKHVEARIKARFKNLGIKPVGA